MSPQVRFGHAPDEFPLDCVKKLTEMIKQAIFEKSVAPLKNLEFLECSLFVASWLAAWIRKQQTPILKGVAEVQDPEVLASCHELVMVLEGRTSPVMEGAITDAIFKILATALVKYLVQKAKELELPQWVIDQLEGLLGQI